MRKSMIALGLLTLAACGSEFAGAQTPSPERAHNTKRAEMIAFPLNNGKIVDVQSVIIPFARPNGALGGQPQTQITIEYRVDCYRKFRSFAYATELSEGKLIVRTHALASQLEPSHANMCLSLTHERKIILVNGYYNEADIELVQLYNAQPVNMTEDIMQVKPAKSVAVLATREMCPADKMCIINGTIIDLGIEVNGCMDRVGPFSYEAQALESGSLTLTIAASEMTSKMNMVAFCNHGPYVRKISVSLPNIYVSTDEIKINSVSGITAQ